MTMHIRHRGSWNGRAASAAVQLLGQWRRPWSGCRPDPVQANRAKQSQFHPATAPGVGRETIPRLYWAATGPPNRQTHTVRLLPSACSAVRAGRDRRPVLTPVLVQITKPRPEPVGEIPGMKPTGTRARRTNATTTAQPMRRRIETHLK